MVRQESFLYEKDDVIYAYGKSIPACPDCGKKMKIHGTCKRNARTAAYPDGKKYVLRVLVCKFCKRTHRELPNFIVPYKGYSFDYMCAVAEKREEPNDSRKKGKIIELFCSIILLLHLCIKNPEHSTVISKNSIFQSIEKYASEIPLDVFKSKSKNSTDMHFTKLHRQGILSAIQQEGVASNESGKKILGIK